ncbi:hypothetical protein MMPV_004699 [Pyropia vietnamensis]
MAMDAASPADAAVTGGAPPAPQRVLRLNPPALFDATPFGYTQLAVDTETRVAHFSGLTSMDMAAEVVGTTLSEQLPLARAALNAALVAVGATPADLLKVTVFVVNYSDADMPAIVENGRALGYPPSTLVGVAALALPALRVELDATATVTAEAVERLRKGGDL